MEEYLKNDYLVVLMDFQEAGSADFQDEDTFSRVFAEMLLGVFRDMGMLNMFIAEEAGSTLFLLTLGHTLNIIEVQK